MRPTSATFACTLIALAIGACSSSPNRSSGFTSSDTAKSSVSAMPAPATTAAAANGAVAGGGGQAETGTAAMRSNK